MGAPLNWLDRAVAYLAPVRALRRFHARAALDLVTKRRGYAASKANGHVWQGVRWSDGSANAELASGLATVRGRSRELYRNNSTVRAALEGLVALVVGTGIDIEPDTGDERADERLREAWRDWTGCASACGRLSFFELQRQGFRSIGLSGDLLWQTVDLADMRRPIPFAVHALEGDQLADHPVSQAVGDFVLGVERDRFGRPLFYHVTDHPGDAFAGLYEIGQNGSAVYPLGQGKGITGGALGNSAARGYRIPAAEIVHAFEILRPGQARGEPMLAPVLATLQQEADLVEAELTAAKIAAVFAAVIQSDAQVSGLSEGSGDTEGGPNGTDGQGNAFTKLEPGIVARLAPGEKIEQVGSTRPSQMIAPFRQMLRGDIAAALRLRQSDLDKDYSRANYSSMRAALLDTKRSLEPVQQWFGHATAGSCYLRALPQLAVAAGVSIPADPFQRRRFIRYKLQPDGFPYVDPEKDVRAALLAITSGLSTWERETGTRGEDWRQNVAQLRKELGDDLLKKIFDASLNVQFGDVPELTAEANGDAPIPGEAAAATDATDATKAKASAHAIRGSHGRFAKKREPSHG